MPKLRPSDDELDVDELEEAEYTEGQFQTYDGEIPKTGTVLTARITKMWWTYTRDDDPLIKALAVAEDNDGDLEEFDGLPVWENLTLTAGGKFRWAPFMEVFGFTIRDVKNKMTIAGEDDNIGAPIERVGTFEPGSDDALCRIVIKKERYNGQWQAKANEWLPYDEEAEEEEEDEPPARSRKAKATSAKRSPARQRRTEPELAEDEDEEEPDEEEEEQPRQRRSAAKSRPPSRSSGSRSGKTSGRRSASAGAKAGRGTRRSRDDEDEPPF